MNLSKSIWQEFCENFPTNMILSVAFFIIGCLLIGKGIKELIKKLK